MSFVGNIAKLGAAAHALPINLAMRGLEAGAGIARNAVTQSPATHLVNRAQNAIAQADTALAQMHRQMSPVELGRTLAGLGSSPAAQFLGPALGMPRGLPGIDLNPFDDIANAAKSAFEGLKEIGGDIKDSLAALPSSAANAVADSMRGPHARKLTPGEEAKLREVFGDSIDLSNVRIVDGPGYNGDAWAAFNIGGNPAITEGNTVYIRSDHFQKDFSTSPEGIELLVHEFTHVRQYQQMGFGSFFAKYGADLVKIGDRNKVYDYQSRPDTTFATETIEGQAQMVGDYARYKAGGNNLTPDQVKDIERRLKGTGIFGL